MSSDNQDPSTPTPSSARTKTAKLLKKIPPIPIRRGKNDQVVEDDNNNNNNKNNDNRGNKEIRENEEPAILLASSLGLNHIKTRSTPSPSPLRFSSSAGFPLTSRNDAKKDKVDAEFKPKSVVPAESKAAPAMMEPGSLQSIFIDQYDEHGKLKLSINVLSNYVASSFLISLRKCVFNKGKKELTVLK